MNPFFLYNDRSESIFTMKPQEVKPKAQTDWLGFCRVAHNVRETDVCACRLPSYSYIFIPPEQKDRLPRSMGSDGRNFSWKRKNGATKRTRDKSIPKLIDEIPYPSLAGTGFDKNQSRR